MFGRSIKNCETCPVGMASPGRCPLTPSFVPAHSLARGTEETPRTVVFIRNGVLALESGPGDEERFSLRGPGSLLGTEALLGRKSLHALRTVTDSWLCSASAAAFQEVTEREPRLMKAVMTLAIEAAADAQKDLATRRGGALERVARLLLAQPISQPSLQVPKATLARNLEMRPETFSRCITQLSREGLVGREGGLRILNREGLLQRAMGEAPAA